MIPVEDNTLLITLLLLNQRGQNYKPEDEITDDKGNEYEKFLDEQGRILNVIPPDPANE